MNDTEKIYLGIIGVLCYVFYFKANKKTTCPSCNCEPTKTVYLPAYIPQPTVVKSEILETALIYTGPSKFEFKSATDVNKYFLYYFDGTKYFKSEYDSTNPNASVNPIEITIKEMIDTWNSIK